MTKRSYQQSKKPFARLLRTPAALGVVLLFCLGLLPCCSFFGSEPDAKGWFGSADELARGVAQALAANDREALDRFRISREEYMAVVWPELPVSKIEQWKSQSGFVWTQHAAKSDAGLRSILARFGGKTLTIRSVICKTPAQEYATFKLHVRPAVEMVDQSGAKQADPVFGTIIEHSGRFKVFSYSIKN
ncbi:MAG: hypothetical protein JW832_08330 [Deltaproteobacteria bacterium]|nr:hypothetical protein [Deltaproteobacteria bacterium]